MISNTTTQRGRRFLSWIVLACTAIFGTACGNWNEFGNGPLNPHNTLVPGPAAGLSTQYNLPPPTASTHGVEVGVLVDRNRDYYVSSYDQGIHAYDNTGNFMGTYSLGVTGSRAVPYVHSEWPTYSTSATIFAGAEGGGFYVIDVDKTTTPFTMSLAASDSTLGTSESSPKRAQDETIYIASQWGDIVRYEYTPTGGLNRLATLSLSGQVVTGAIALYDLDPQYADEEVLVATTRGNFYVLDHSLSTIIWSNSSGASTSDVYYAGVTVAERGVIAPVALLPIAGEGDPNSGLVRAINLWTQAVEWELVPSQTVLSEHAIPGSVAVLHDQTGFTQQAGQPGQDDRWDDNQGGILEGGGNFGGSNSGPNIPPIDANFNSWAPFNATFASTDGYLYGIDIVAGTEIWNYRLQAPGQDAPVVDNQNIIYVGDGSSTLHAVEGKLSNPGLGLWMDGSISSGGTSDIVKLGVTNTYGLVVGTDSSAYALFQ
ncbi:MAG: hypothetical protein CL917_00180 [Deltaproteobacteria bacterium]|nr:hypothetical protein [Deltaproteobacteria bacterium]